MMPQDSANLFCTFTTNNFAKKDGKISLQKFNRIYLYTAMDVSLKKCVLQTLKNSLQRGNGLCTHFVYNLYF